MMNGKLATHKHKNNDSKSQLGYIQNCLENKDF